jgi:hypothetical protein
MTRAEPHHARPICPRWPQALRHFPAAGSPRRHGRHPGQPRQSRPGTPLAGGPLPDGQHCRRPLSTVPLGEAAAPARNTRGR